MSDRCRRSASGGPLVGVVEDVDDLLAVPRLAEEADELVVLEVPGDVLQGAEVVAGAVGGGDEQEEDVDRLAVEGGEVDALAGQRDGADEAVDGRVAGVGDGDPLASALAKIESGVRSIPMNVQPAAAQAFIVNPLTGRKMAFSSLFRTHPPTAERIERLRSGQWRS